MSVSDADVCRMSRCRGRREFASSGSAPTTSRVTRWKPRSRGSSVRSHAGSTSGGQSCHAQVDAARRERTPSASSSAALAVALASEPSARTTRCHGTSLRRRVEHGAGEARRAGRDVAVGAHEARRDRRDARRAPPRVASSLTASSGHDDTLRRGAPTGTYSIVARDPEPGRAGRRRPVALVLRRLGRLLGARRASAPWRRSRSPSPPTGRALDRSRRASRREAALDRCSRATSSAAFRQVAVVDARGRVGDPHRRRLHRVRRPRRRRRLQRRRRT